MPPDPLTRNELLVLYRMACDERRVEVAMGWARQRFYLCLVTAVSVVAILAPTYPAGACAVLCLGTLAAVVGLLTVRLCHRHVWSAGVLVKKLELELGLDRMDLGLQTTDERGLSTRWRFRLYVGAMVMLGAWALVDLVAAVLVWR